MVTGCRCVILVIGGLTRVRGMLAVRCMTEIIFNIHIGYSILLRRFGQRRIDRFRSNIPNVNNVWGWMDILNSIIRVVVPVSPVVIGCTMDEVHF